MKWKTIEWVQSAALSLGIAFVSIQFLSLSESALIAAGAFGIALLWFRKKPVLLEQRRLKQLDAQLPLVLQTIGVDLTLDIPFEQSIERVGLQHSALGKEFAKAWNEIERQGSSVPEALFRLGERNPSTAMRRSVSQLLAAYHQGSGNASQSIQTLSKEMLSRRRSEIRAFSGKMALYSLVFIAFSAILPALFQSYALIGSAFLQPTLSAWQSVIVLCVLFPLLDVALIAFIQWTSPQAQNN